MPLTATSFYEIAELDNREDPSIVSNMIYHAMSNKCAIFQFVRKFIVQHVLTNAQHSTADMY